MRYRLNYGDTPYAHELAQAGSSRQEQQASPLDHGDAGEQSSVPMGQRRFLPTGSAVRVRGWTAYTSAAQQESAAQRTTDAGHSRRNAGSDPVKEEQWTEKDKKLLREYTRLQSRGELDMATPEQRAANSLQVRISRLNPDIYVKDKQRKAENRSIASRWRNYLAEREGLWIPVKDLQRKKTFQTPGAVYRAAQERGYTQDKGTLKRRAERYADNPEGYQDTDRE